MSHPFAWCPERAQRAALPPAIALALVLMALLARLGAPLETAAAPLGILSFELAGSAERAGAILASWDERARLYAALGLGLDYLFLVAYPLAIGLACARLAGALARRRPRAAAAGSALAWGQLAAGALDALENAALIRLLLGGAAGPWAALARACAVPKFALVAAGLLYVLVGVGLAARGRGDAPR